MPESNIEEQDFLGLESEAVDLVERSVGNSGTMRIKIIQPGWGSSGFYPEEVLRSDGPKAWPAGTHMFLDHPSRTEAADRPERSVRDLAGVTISDPVYEDKGPAGPGLYADAKVLPQFKDVIEALAPHIGVSIRAHGVFRPGEIEGRKGKVIERIDSGESIDFVTKAGAGGKVLALMESLRPTPASAAEAESNPTASEDGMDELKEAQDRVASLTTDLAETKTALAEAETRAERAEMAVAMFRARALAEAELATVSLPEASKRRIVESHTLNPTITDGALDEAALKTAIAEAAKDEAAYIEAIVGTGTITGQGQHDSAKDKEVSQESLANRFASFFKLDEKAASLAAKGR